MEQKQAISKLVCWYDERPDTRRLMRRWEDAAGPIGSDELLCYDATSECLVDDALGEYPDRELGIESDSSWLGRRPDLSEEFRRALHDALPRDKDGGVIGPDLGSHVQIIEDQDRRVVFTGGDAQRFADDYAKTLPIGWRDGVVLCLRKGAPVVIVRWTPERERISVTQEWAGRQCDLVNGEQKHRWRVLRFFDDAERCIRVPIPPARIANRTAQDLVARAPEQPAGEGIIPTRIPALDAALALGGVPRGARVIVQGPPEAGKTLLMLEVAASYAASGLSVAWLATGDEAIDPIFRRWCQRGGMSREEAAAAPFRGMLTENLMLVDGTAFDMEEVLPEFDVTFVDSLQEVRTRAGAGAGEIEKVKAALSVIADAKKTVWASSWLVRNAARRVKREASKGGSGVEYSATMLLHVELEGDVMTVELLKSRHGGKGTVLTLSADVERQRVGPAASAHDDLQQRIEADVLVKLAERPRSQRELEADVTGTAVKIRNVVKALIARGIIQRGPDSKLVLA